MSLYPPGFKGLPEPWPDCPRCNGTGQEPEPKEVYGCGLCRGTGRVSVWFELCPVCWGNVRPDRCCLACRGTGKVREITDWCPRCGGTGIDAEPDPETGAYDCSLCHGSGAISPQELDLLLAEEDADRWVHQRLERD